MSLATARVRTPSQTGRESERHARPRLRIVAHSAPEGHRVPFFAVCAAILSAALLAALALNTSMAATSYTIRDRTIELSQATITAQTLATEVEAAGAPDAVIARARTLGLVPSEGVTYLDLASMSLVGGGE